MTLFHEILLSPKLCSRLLFRELLFESKYHSRTSLGKVGNGDIENISNSLYPT